MTLFSSLSPTQINLLHTILYREVLDARRGRWSKMEKEELERMYAEATLKSQEAGSSKVKGNAGLEEVRNHLQAIYNMACSIGHYDPQIASRSSESLKIIDDIREHQDTLDVEALLDELANKYAARTIFTSDIRAIVEKTIATMQDYGSGDIGTDITPGSDAYGMYAENVPANLETCPACGIVKEECQVLPTAADLSLAMKRHNEDDAEETATQRGIPMSAIKVGMKLKNILSPSEPIVTVTELTENGFRFEHEPRTVKTGYNCGISEFGTVRGGEHYGYLGYSYYEEVT